MERLIDLAAKQSGIDRVELRRRNLVRKDSFPHRNGLGLTYDSGDYRGAMDKALRLSDWAGFKARRREARRRGKHRGIGIANYVEATSGAPRERSELRVRPDGIVEMTLGTFASGQGHETAFPQLRVRLARRFAGEHPLFRPRHRPDRGRRRLALGPLDADREHRGARGGRCRDRARQGARSLRLQQG